MNGWFRILNNSHQDHYQNLGKILSKKKRFSFIFSSLDRFLTVAEQMVTFHQSADMTTTLNEKGYWASYNNIYFPDFRIISGEEQLVTDKGPELYSWANSSRARIFERDQHTVVDLTTMTHMIRLITIIC